LQEECSETIIRHTKGLLFVNEKIVFDLFALRSQHIGNRRIYYLVSKPNLPHDRHGLSPFHAIYDGFLSLSEDKRTDNPVVYAQFYSRQTGFSQSAGSPIFHATIFYVAC
jgi:hypothetical protein